MPAGRLYFDGILNRGSTVELSASDAHYVSRVLRLSLNDNVVLFNGSGGEYRCSIERLSKKHVAVKVVEWVDINNESPLTITLAQAISRSDRMDFAVQKAVELGVNHIVPIVTERCNVKLNDSRWLKKKAHWQAIAISAAQQSNRCMVPQVSLPCLLDEWVAQEQEVSIIADPYVEQSTIHDIKSVSAVRLLIGPEGGFTEAERQRCYQSNFYAMRLGPRVLRTETACVAALAILQQTWGDIF